MDRFLSLTQIGCRSHGKRVPVFLARETPRNTFTRQTPSGAEFLSMTSSRVFVPSRYQGSTAVLNDQLLGSLLHLARNTHSQGRLGPGRDPLEAIRPAEATFLHDLTPTADPNPVLRCRPCHHRSKLI